MRRYQRHHVGGYYTPSANTSTSAPSATITGNASPNTKGSWIEMIASTAYPCSGLLINTRSAAEALVDVGIGGSGSEVVIVNNIHIGIPLASREGNPFYVSIPLPSGTRVAARSQGASGSTNPQFAIALVRGVNEAYGVIDTYGANTSDSGGVSIDPGGSTNTKGAWVEVTASTTRAYKAFHLGFGGNNDSTRTNANWLVDVGLGAASSEQVIVSNYSIACNANHDGVLPLFSQRMYIPIPAGTRISVRAQCDITTAGDRLFDVFFYGYA